MRTATFPHTIELAEQLKLAGLPASHPRLPALVSLYQRLRGLPRHLGQHSGGMIICQGQLDSVMPLENASMPGRVVAQWDKDDCEDLGIIKVDFLGLGMMAASRTPWKSARARGRPVRPWRASPKDDPRLSPCCKKADTIGVFQVESRAQMATLPRMKPARSTISPWRSPSSGPALSMGRRCTPTWSAGRAGQAVTYPDERLRPILSARSGSRCSRSRFSRSPWCWRVLRRRCDEFAARHRLPAFE